MQYVTTIYETDLIKEGLRQMAERSMDEEFPELEELRDKIRKANKIVLITHRLERKKYG